MTAKSAAKPVGAATFATLAVKAVIPSADGISLDLGARGTVPFASVARIL